ncbi:hypothetical protein [Endozoicomonas sp. ALB091]|uniref:hypothetical protein n=1 Tax=Endozoicomonas sp. ALB091 TaxID=3403073 RepID=UPI003BB4C052
MGYSPTPSASDPATSPCFICGTCVNQLSLKVQPLTMAQFHRCGACHEVATVSYWLNDPEQLVSFKRWLEFHDTDSSNTTYSTPRFSPVVRP